MLPVLRGVSPTLCAPYLEAALAAHVASRETYETELAVMYLQALLEGGPGPSGDQAEVASPTHVKLRLVRTLAGFLSRDDHLVSRKTAEQCVLQVRTGTRRRAVPSPGQTSSQRNWTKATPSKSSKRW